MPAIPCEHVDELVKAVLSDRLWHACYRRVTWTYRDGTLTLRGEVPSFYIKQMLQEQLGSIREVREINNQVDVVSSIGLSSVRPK